MRIFAVSDLHLSGNCPKPMDIFGQDWERHWEKIQADWRSRVGEEDLVLIGGDISWAMTIAQAQVDLDEIDALPGQKILLRGNHDYWWSSLTQVSEAMGPAAARCRTMRFAAAGALSPAPEGGPSQGPIRMARTGRSTAGSSSG